MSSSQARRSAARLFRQEHVKHRKGIIGLVHLQADQPAGVRRHGSLAQLRGTHFAKSLEARDRDLAPGELPHDRGALFLGQCVVSFLADIQPVERRHHDVDVAIAHQRREMPRKQRADQGCDMPSVGISVRENAHAVIPKGAQVRLARLYPQGHGDVVDFL